MGKIDDFVKAARGKALPEETIRKSLISAGWTDDQVDKALLSGLEVPTPDGKPAASSSRPSLGSLESALLHVLLWFFVAASTVAISAVVSSLFGESVSSEALASMMAVAVITFTPYSIFFLRFLRKLRTNPELIPGRVWSIITVCIHSVGAMIAGITLAVGLIVDSGLSLTVGAALIATLNIIVLVTYAASAFARPSKRRHSVLALHLIALAILLGSLFVISIMRLAPSQADSQTQQQLVEAAQEVSQTTSDQGQLPNQADLSLPEAVDYRQTGDHTYQLCADFQLASGVDNRSPNQPIYDDFVGDYDFNQHQKGNQCFELKSSHLDSQDFGPTHSGPVRMN